MELIFFILLQVVDILRQLLGFYEIMIKRRINVVGVNCEVVVVWNKDWRIILVKLSEVF